MCKYYKVIGIKGDAITLCNSSIFTSNYFEGRENVRGWGISYNSLSNVVVQQQIDHERHSTIPLPISRTLFYFIFNKDSASKTFQTLIS